MQNDVRELSDNELRRLVVLYAREVKNWPEAEDAVFAVFERLSALRAEVERLESEAVVMRELCLQALLKAEAEKLLKNDDILHSDYAIEVQSYEEALNAYRAMKGEKDAERNGNSQ